MIRTLLTSTALAALLATGAMAQQNTSTPPANAAEPATPPSTDTNTPANTTAAPANTTAPATETTTTTTTTAPADTTTATPPAADTTMAPANTTTTPAPADTTTMAPANTTTTDTTSTTTNTDAAAAANATTESGRTPIVLEQGFSRLTGDDLASNIMGADVYNSAADDADDIGEINDLVVGQDGNVAAAVIGVGGFLGIGEKNVAVDFDSLELTQAADGSFRYVLNTTEDALKAAPDFQWDDTNPADVQGVDADRDGVADNQTATGDNAANAANNAANGVAAGAAATADAAGNMAAGAANTTADAVNNATGTPSVGTIDPNSMQTVAPEAMTADNLDGTAVYGANNEQVGSISDFVLNAQGQIDAVVVDVGGFLGIGAKPVALGFDNLNFRQDQNGTRYLFINATREQLEAQPQFDADTYEQNRDTMRMTAQ